MTRKSFLVSIGALIAAPFVKTKQEPFRFQSIASIDPRAFKPRTGPKFGCIHDEAKEG